MKESVAVAKEADAKKDFSPTKSDNSIHRVRNEPERQLGSLRDVIGNIRHDGGMPSVDSIATQLSGMHTTQRAPVLLALQRTHGNRYVQRVVSGIQAKLKVGQPGDIYEQEADRVADEVMRMPEPQVQRQSGEEERRVEEALQTKEVSGRTPEVTQELEDNILTLSGGGQPLPEFARAFFELRFGYNFSQVRLHTDALAAEMARTLNARAYTEGSDIVFGAGQYAPATSTGKKLLAHELTHVVQQAGAGLAIQRNDESTSGGPGPAGETVGDVSVYVGRTMTAEAALRAIYAQGARRISEEGLRMVANGTPLEEAARWAHQARNDLKVQIRARGSPITHGLAEARNIRKYGNRIGPTYDDLIRQGRTPEDIIGSAGRANRKMNRVVSRFRVAGRFLIAVDLAIITWEVVSAPESEGLRTAVSGVGGLAGAAAVGWIGAKGGAALGAGIGSFFGPGLGTAIGGAIGGVIGGIGGAIVGGLAGRAAGEAAYEFVEELVTSNLDEQMREIDAAEGAYIRAQAR